VPAVSGELGEGRVDNEIFYCTAPDNLYAGVYFAGSDRKIACGNKGAERTRDAVFS